MSPIHVARARSLPRARPARPATASALGFGLFLVLTAVLFVRPTEVLSSFDGVPLFQAVILACMAVSFPSILGQLRLGALCRRPITICVIGVAAAVPLSLLTTDSGGDVAGQTAELLKVVAYYLVFLAVVDSPGRLRVFLAWLLACLSTHTALALLNFHGVVTIPEMRPVIEVYGPDEIGAPTQLLRMCGSGIFGNPNDLSRMLAVGIALSAYLGTELPRRFVPVLLALAGMFAYALFLTHSRGGLLAAAATVFIWLQGRYGGKRTALLGGAALAVFLAAFGGSRLADLTADEGTGQQRIQLWLEGFASLRESPVFGIGSGRYPEITGGLVAHNSFVHGFVELGLVGGTCFLSAVILALWQTYRLRPGRIRGLSGILARAEPIVLAMVAGYAVGMLTSSRTHVTPTYLLLGLAAVYQRLAEHEAPWLARPLTGQMIAGLAATSGIVLIALYALAQSMVRWT